MIPKDLSNLKIVHYPDPVLRKKASPVTEFGPELKAFADRMVEMMHDGDGVGLAAPQVAVSIRLFVCNPTGDPGRHKIYINPELTDKIGAADLDEGCLSLPGINVMMRRAAALTIRAKDLEGNDFEEKAEGLLARIWQHENDHLDGRLLIDNMSETDEIANRRAIKQLKEAAARSR